MIKNQHRVWKRLGQKTVYKGRMHVIEYSVELPNGQLSTYEVDHGLKGAAAVLIKLPDDRIVLTYQFRFPVNQWMYDLPGGGVGENETPEDAAIRECCEEVGMTPNKIERLATFYPNPARTDWPAHIFYCEDFTSSKLTLNDPSEIVEHVLMPVTEFKRLVDNQKIIDPMLLIGWYTACSKGLIKL